MSYEVTGYFMPQFRLYAAQLNFWLIQKSKKACDRRKMMKDVCGADPQYTTRFSDVFHFVQSLPFHKYFLTYMGINIHLFSCISYV